MGSLQKLSPISPFPLFFIRSSIPCHVPKSLSPPRNSMRFCTFSVDWGSTRLLFRERSCKENGLRAGVSVRVSDPELKQNWLSSLSCPFMENEGKPCLATGSTDPGEYVLGIDPDLSGALAILKGKGADLSAKVFDTPHVRILVGKRVRRRLDARSIVQLLCSLEIPNGTVAYIEQSAPFPKDGKQGWWSGGYAYGLWIGILIASGFSVVPVPCLLWKNQFELSGNSSSKDDSRIAASVLFPSLSSSFVRKKDHGRAEALLIAAYGKGLKKPSEMCVDYDSLEEKC